MRWETDEMEDWDITFTQISLILSAIISVSIVTVSMTQILNPYTNSQSPIPQSAILSLTILTITAQNVILTPTVCTQLCSLLWCICLPPRHSLKYSNSQDFSSFPITPRTFGMTGEIIMLVSVNYCQITGIAIPMSCLSVLLRV